MTAQGTSGAIPLRDLATTIRSKNAGVLHVTFDVLFRDAESYELARGSGVLNREVMAELYGVSPEDVVTCVFFDPGLAFKFTIRRHKPAGTPGEPDVFGSQLYAPLFSVHLPASAPDHNGREGPRQ